MNMYAYISFYKFYFINLYIYNFSNCCCLFTHIACWIYQRKRSPLIKTLCMQIKSFFDERRCVLMMKWDFNFNLKVRKAKPISKIKWHSLFISQIPRSQFECWQWLLIDGCPAVLYKKWKKTFRLKLKQADIFFSISIN